jgi:NAD(P) transhydrogenase subunit alpha
MDALTSMSTVSGYKSVLIAANLFPRFIPLIGTAIGTFKAARFLIVGTGVVGLQAIATAKRLGGSVAAVDIRDDARKAAQSLGAKIVGFEIPAEVAIAADGRTRAIPESWLAQERAALASQVAEADIVILSALVPGEMAPVLLAAETLTAMRPGSIVVDVAIDQGGNCAVTTPGAEATHAGVLVLGLWNIPGSMPVDSSRLYAHNMLHFVKNLFKTGLDTLDLDDDIVRPTLVTRDGQILHEGTLKAMADE